MNGVAKQDNKSGDAICVSKSITEREEKGKGVSGYHRMSGGRSRFVFSCHTSQVESALLKEEAKAHRKHGDHVTLTAFVLQISCNSAGKI